MKLTGGINVKLTDPDVDRKTIKLLVACGVRESTAAIIVAIMHFKVLVGRAEGLAWAADRCSGVRDRFIAVSDMDSAETAALIARRLGRQLRADNDAALAELLRLQSLIDQEEPN